MLFRSAEEFGEELRDMGHKVYEWDDMTWLAGSVCTIVNDHKNGVLHGGADPRRPAYVLGWRTPKLAAKTPRRQEKHRHEGH